MHNNAPYVMKDQVRDLIPNIMDFDVRRRRHKGRSFLELSIFGLATTAYLIVLAVSV